MVAAPTSALTNELIELMFAVTSLNSSHSDTVSVSVPFPFQATLPDAPGVRTQEPVSRKIQSYRPPDTTELGRAGAVG